MQGTSADANCDDCQGTMLNKLKSGIPLNSVPSLELLMHSNIHVAMEIEDVCALVYTKKLYMTSTCSSWVMLQASSNLNCPLEILECRR